MIVGVRRTDACAAEHYVYVRIKDNADGVSLSLEEAHWLLNRLRAAIAAIQRPS